MVAVNRYSIDPIQAMLPAMDRLNTTIDNLSARCASVQTLNMSLDTSVPTSNALFQELGEHFSRLQYSIEKIFNNVIVMRNILKVQCDVLLSYSSESRLMLDDSVKENYLGISETITSHLSPLIELSLEIRSQELLARTALQSLNSANYRNVS